MAEKWLYTSTEHKRQFGSYSIEIDGNQLEYCRITQGEPLTSPFQLVATLSEAEFNQAVSNRMIKYQPA